MKFSVLLPTRNRKELLASAIESVLYQDYKNWEIIISDNFSDEDICGYINSIKDSRIKYFRTESFITVTDNWNNALEKSNGDYIIMLGDDDCLLKNYFSTLIKYIKKFNAPDLIYTNALLYSYPGVFKESPEGFLYSYSNRVLFNGFNSPYLLDKKKALEMVNNSLNFKTIFDYNMQFSLVSKKLIHRMKKYGRFYQSPYPDYYASNAIMLKAKKILVFPKPSVVIGISKKSFGFYYFNDEEDKGVSFLKNNHDTKILNSLADKILPGSNMNNSWLFSMQHLVNNFSDEIGLRISYKRYRLIQISNVYCALLLCNKNAIKKYSDLKNELTLIEKFCFMFLRFFKILPLNFKLFLSKIIFKLVDSHPINKPMPIIDGKFNNIIEVFNNVDIDKL